MRTLLVLARGDPAFEGRREGANVPLGRDGSVDGGVFGKPFSFDTWDAFSPSPSAETDGASFEAGTDCLYC